MKRLNILVTGANGQLGRCIQDLAKTTAGEAYNFFFTDVDTLDICKADQIEQAVTEHQIDAIVNACGYTAVDKAEDERKQAFAINRDGTANLAFVARQHDLYLVHISTDYVYSGNACKPYRESDAIGPLSIYGKSKAAGEVAIHDMGCNATIIRTSWLYSEYGNNFVKTMLRLGDERDQISVVCDQIGAPTYAGDLAKAIFKTLECNIDKKGVIIYNFSNEGSITWFDFAKSIMEIGGRECDVLSIFTEEYPTKAMRPAYSVFNLRKIKEELGIDIPYWRESLTLIINKLNK
ncbi:MAG: dTDP-4-dehydrorhamnose reductase [Bacteroidales bacterium]|nr:dTDP-4-dehydrorhamnose reductase [Bacteroidales bacterium]